jgi:hypothetical protein
VPSFILYFFLYQVVKEKKLVRLNPSCAPTFAGYALTLTIGCALALINYKTNALINRKVLSSVKVKLAFFL